MKYFDIYNNNGKDGIRYLTRFNHISIMRTMNKNFNYVITYILCIVWIKNHMITFNIPFKFKKIKVQQYIRDKINNLHNEITQNKEVW